MIKRNIRHMKRFPNQDVNYPTICTNYKHFHHLHFSFLSWAELPLHFRKKRTNTKKPVVVLEISARITKSKSMFNDRVNCPQMTDVSYFWSLEQGMGPMRNCSNIFCKYFSYVTPFLLLNYFFSFFNIQGNFPPIQNLHWLSQNLSYIWSETQREISLRN